MLVCYLDDSGKDPQSAITCVAGYVAREPQWEAFETAVEPWFTEFNVDVLHATDLRGTRGAFTGWSVLRKQAFVERVCQARNPNILLGVSMSAEKKAYQGYRKQHVGKRTLSPYTFCFNVIVDWIFRDVRLGSISNADGVAFMVESGHENNAEAEDVFYSVREAHNLTRLMHSIAFVPKTSSRAIQLADLFAYYSRRDFVALLKAHAQGKKAYSVDSMLRLITNGAPHRGYVATGFDQDGRGKPFMPEGDWPQRLA